MHCRGFILKDQDADAPSCLVWRIRPAYFLLLARYVPNVAKRSIWDQCKKKYILKTDRWPTDLSFGPHLGNFKWPYLREGSSDPLNVWFYVGFSGTPDRMALFPVSPNPRWRPRASILENSNGDISAADRPIYSVFGSRMGFSGSADRMTLIPFLTKFNRYVGENNARGVINLKYFLLLYAGALCLPWFTMANWQWWSFFVYDICC